MHISYKLCSFLLILAVCLFLPSFAWAQAGSEPKSVAVLNFDSKDAKTSGTSSSDAGSAIPAILTTELAKSDRFTVVDRDQLELVLNEQNLGQSGIMNPETSARLGRVLGVDYLIVGKLTEFTIEKGKQSSSGFLGFKSTSKASDKAHVSVALKVLDSESARIVAVAECRKTYDMKNATHNYSVQSVSTSSGDVENSDTAMANLYYEVAHDLAMQLENAHFKTLPPRVKYTGFIGHIENNKVYINLGANKGISEKMVFTVRREENKGTMVFKRTLGEIRVLQADEENSECEILKQDDAFKIGDLVETKF